MRRVFLAVILTATLLGACGGGPNGPGPPPPAAPQITCGSAITVDNVVGLAQAVSYAPPSTLAGAPPVNVSCTPPAGSDFPLGTTTVTCTATDAQARQASCSFTVSLTHREVALTRYLAFGDSLTAGENGRPVNFLPFIDTANAYPTFLQQFFNERIPAQQITVVNAGKPGEKVADSDSRLKGDIARNRSEVLLMLQGINDLNDGASPQTVVSYLRDNIRTAKDRGVQYVFVSTLLPVAPENFGPPAPFCRAFTSNTRIATTNDMIRGMVPASGGHLVDPYADFNANRGTYIDVDCLHLRPAGNRALATAFWDRIVQVVPPRQLVGE